jgi:superfamily I DNA and/or RNA helicase
MLRQVSPTVVLVEEAGEILEPQVLTTLSSHTEQLIMIGDHRQLRPKLENFKLSKASNNCLDLDASMFERLVLASASSANALPLPVVTLHVQHRMPPFISRLIREITYPQLIDHESTKSRSSVKGTALEEFALHRPSPCGGARRRCGCLGKSVQAEHR